MCAVNLNTKCNVNLDSIGHIEEGLNSKHTGYQPIHRQHTTAHDAGALAGVSAYILELENILEAIRCMLFQAVH